MDSPREKLLTYGAKSLSDSELLAILLRTGTREMPVLQLANKIFEETGGWNEMLGSSWEELVRYNGIGSAKVATLLAVREIMYRFQKERRDTHHIQKAEDAYALFSDLANEPQEVLAAAFLDVRNRLLRRSDIYRGTLSSVLAEPREILREALRANAAKIYIAHNHPSQDPTPSDEDIRFTLRLKEAANLCGLTLAGHLIVCSGGRYTSIDPDFDVVT